MAAPQGNTNGQKHGAEGAMKRIQTGLPLAEDDKLLRDEIITALGYDPNALPAGPLGYLIDLIGDNVLLALRFRGARHYAADRGDLNLYAALSQRSGWRNDKAIGQLAELIKLQAGMGDDKIIDAIASARGTNGSDNATD